MPIDLNNFPTFDPTVHCAPREARAAEGDRVNTYDGLGTVMSVRECSFYGAPPMQQGLPTQGGWDGLRYTVKLDNGDTTPFDRSRLRRV